MAECNQKGLQTAVIAEALDGTNINVCSDTTRLSEDRYRRRSITKA
jgi:hypothetical protein